MSEKIINPSCVRNQQPIFDALSPWLSGNGPLLELASGTGQHGVHICGQRPNLQWQLTEHPSQVALSHPWQQEAQLCNLLPCLPLDITQITWPVPSSTYQYAYCANLLHFVSADNVNAVFKGISLTLKKTGLFFCYGPINENGFTSDGNANLDEWLKHDVNPQAGIKELILLQECADRHGLRFKERLNLPANNVILVFEK